MSTRAGTPGSPERPLVRADLVRIAARRGVPPDVVEKDYVLSYLLAGLATIPELGGLRFKGGTALKKVYFGDYRFSEDLDFSATTGPQGQELDTAMAAAIQATDKLLARRGRFRIEFDRPPERAPHPQGQDAYRVRVAFPWQTIPMVRVKVEVTHDEPVLLPAVERPLLHGYDELDEHLDHITLATYALEEIVAEKLRALRQTQARLDARGWNRPRARDYYDLWRILSERAELIDGALVRRILPEKFARRGVSYTTVEDFFTPALVGEARRNWQPNLGTFVAVLPDLDLVLTSLPRLLHRMLEETSS